MGIRGEIRGGPEVVGGGGGDARPMTANPSRLLWVDLVRAGALLVVVLGHWLIALVTITPDPVTGAAALEAAALLDVAPWTHPLTWLLQVMSCFFAVGGFVAARRWGRRPLTARSWADFTASRARGLLVPALPLLALWLLAGPALAGRFGDSLVTFASQAALVPLWFLAVYLLVQALVPVWMALADRVAIGRLLLATLAAVMVIDVAHLGGVPLVGWGNFVAVWSLPTLLGIAVAREAVAPRELFVTAVTALVVAVGLVLLAGYEVPLVGVSGSERSNNSPPSLLLAVHGLAYSSAALALAPRLEGWLRATRTRRRVLAAASTWSMGLYLWHLTGLVALAAVALVAPLPGIDPLLAVTPLTPVWWVTRPLFMLVATVATLVLIALVAKPTGWLTARSAGMGRPRPVAAAVATLAASAGIAGIVLRGAAAPRWWAVAALLVAVALLHPPAGSGAPAASAHRALGDAEDEDRGDHRDDEPDDVQLPDVTRAEQ